MIRAMRKSPNIMEHSLVYGISQDHRVGIIFGSRMSYILLYFEIFMPHQKIFVPFRQKDEFYLISKVSPGFSSDYPKTLVAHDLVLSYFPQVF